MLRREAIFKNYSESSRVSLQLWLQASLREEPWTPFRVHVETTAGIIEEVNGSKRRKPAASRPPAWQHPVEPDSFSESGNQTSSCDKEVIQPDEPGLLSRKLHTALGSVV
jgi:hypothetical protein